MQLEIEQGIADICTYVHMYIPTYVHICEFADFLLLFTWINVMINNFRSFFLQTNVIIQFKIVLNKKCKFSPVFSVKIF
jgi:hypothetical protein